MRRLAIDPSGKRSFRTALLGFVLGSLAVTVGAIGVVAFLNSMHTMDVIKNRQYELTTRIMEHEVTMLLLPAQKFLLSQSTSATRGLIDLNDLSSRGEIFAESLRVEPDLSWLSYGDAATGRFVGARRDEDGRVVVNTSDPSIHGGRPSEYVLNEDGTRVPIESTTAPLYDPRQRDWFKNAAAAGKPVWSVVYPFNDGTKGITLSAPAYDYESGKLLGVFTADYTLKSVGHFLLQLIGTHQRLLILTSADGSMMGWASTLEGDSGADVSRTLSSLPITPADLAPEQAQGFEYKLDGEKMFGVVRRMEPLPGFECVAIAAAREEEFFGPVLEGARHTAALGLCALILAAIAASYLAHRMSEPLRLISENLGRVASFDLQKSSAVHSMVREISVVGESVERMKSGLRSFGKYVPTTLVKQLLSRGLEAELGGSERELTIMFADLAGFTKISEHLAPSQTVEEMREYFQLATEAVETHEGTLDKFLGDGILAFFNAPLDVPHHAGAACRAALEIRDRLRVLEEPRQNAGRPLLQVRIGLATGEVLVGNIGTSERFAYTVFGDTANLAARLESLNKQYGTTIMASESVVAASGANYEWRLIDCVAVVGRSEGTKVYELLCEQGALDNKQAAFRTAYDSALASYLVGDFANAAEQFKALSSETHDKASEVLSERSSRFATVPPKSWDGVFIADVK